MNVHKPQREDHSLGINLDLGPACHASDGNDTPVIDGHVGKKGWIFQVIRAAAVANN